MKSKLACLMQVTLLVVGHGLVSQDERKRGGMMWLMVPSRKKDDSGKSCRKVEIKKNISKQKGRQIQLSMQQGKVHKKPKLVILKAMINRIKS